MTNEVLYEKQEEIGILQINRPHVRNSLNWSAQEQFAGIVSDVAHDQHIRVLIITGAGDKAFVSGGDLQELAQHPEKSAGIRLKETMTRALQQLTELPIPVIAGINGDAIGGGFEIVTACDLRMTVPHARFRMAQANVGLTTGWGGTARLVHLLGQSRALELLLTSRMITAQEGMTIGLLHQIVEGDVLSAAMAWAQELMTLPRAAVAANKALVYATAQHLTTTLEALEYKHFVDLWGQPDHREALSAFLQKRST